VGYDELYSDESSTKEYTARNLSNLLIGCLPVLLFDHEDENAKFLRNANKLI
jgi:hypothetical protein